MGILNHLRISKKISERTLAEKCGIARDTLRTCESDWRKAKFETLEKIAGALGYEMQMWCVPIGEIRSELSVVGISMAVARDGFDFWKIHFFNFVDYFRKTKDARLIVLPPIEKLDIRLRALLSAIVVCLCEEAGIDTPLWARREIFLDTPWFVSGMESLKATCIVESPLPFRRNNIFVQDNFLNRA